MRKMKTAYTASGAIEKALDSFAQLRGLLKGSEFGGGWRLCYEQELAARVALAAMDNALDPCIDKLNLHMDTATAIDVRVILRAALSAALSRHFEVRPDRSCVWCFNRHIGRDCKGKRDAARQAVIEANHVESAGIGATLPAQNQDLAMYVCAYDCEHFNAMLNW